ncbi:hypothetical protein P43SY_003050 [Pythium insidiosum]|uniref:Glycosyl transferase family 1 domain-containing protein n=1 Tax=Pythium insidiosum TaxID=114742 RepID=A0AAD5QB66_PYTIN|nr:hypothetical protein P43SY_003050 [Pythium insidiosum]
MERRQRRLALLLTALVAGAVCISRVAQLTAAGGATASALIQRIADDWDVHLQRHLRGDGTFDAELPLYPEEIFQIDWRNEVSAQDLSHSAALHNACMTHKESVIPWDVGLDSGINASSRVLNVSDDALVSVLAKCPDVDIFLPAGIRGHGYCEDAVAYAKYLRSRLLPGWVFSSHFFDARRQRNVTYHELCPHTPLIVFNHYWDGVPDAPDWPATKPLYLMPNIEMFELQAKHYERADVVLCKTAICARYVTLWYAQQLPERRNATVLFTRHTTTHVAHSIAAVKSWTEPSFIHVGGSSSQKGTARVLRCWLSRPDLPTIDVFVSKHNYKRLFAEEFDHELQSGHDNVRLHVGQLDAASFGRHIAEASVFLCPSYMEGYGHYINQARAAGGLIVTTNAAPMNELVTPSSGVLVDAPTSYFPQQLLGGFSDQRKSLRNVTGLVARVRSVDLCGRIDDVLRQLSPTARKQRAERARQQYFFDTSGVRADGVAWAACKLLLPHRRPPVCQERMVAGFLRRYGMEDRSVPRHAMAPVGSPGEQELQALLDVIQASHASYRIVCVEAVEYDRGSRSPVKYTATVYGCGSANQFASAFAGHHATFLKTLMHDKAWLTVDALVIMGLRFAIRQNNKSIFSLQDSDGNGSVIGTHTTLVNFSMFGNLYALLLVVDIGLAFVHLLSALEVLGLLLLPRLWRRPAAAAAASSSSLGRSGPPPPSALARRHVEVIGFGSSSYFSMFSRSLYRCHTVAALTVVSQLISWQIILPNAVIWTWSVSSKGKLQAYMSTFRVWVLLLICFNALWDIVVFLRERWAYAFARRTFVTTMELMAIGAVVAFLKRDEVFAMGEKKYALERQRLVDVTSFDDAIGFANVYNDALDGQFLPSLEALDIMYMPLLRMLGISVASIFGLLLLKLAYLQARSRWGQSQRQSEDQSERYERLPIERLLREPLRAKSLIRNDLPVDFVLQARRSLKPNMTLTDRVEQLRSTLRSRGVFIWWNVFILAAIFSLDVRDLLYKVVWLGPYDSYSFQAIATIDIDLQTPLAAPALSPSRPSSSHVLKRPSGWSSFLEKCDSIYGSPFVINAMGKNCDVGTPTTPHIVPQLLLSSGIRSDAVAWSACKLLFPHRRPAICQERMVTRFLKRYAIEDHTVPRKFMAKANSESETELLQLLHVIGSANPSSQLVCVESVEYSTGGAYSSTIYGCGSPNLFLAAFAGANTPYLKELVGDKAWLTIDMLNFMGLRFGIRQNNKSRFTLEPSADARRIVGTHKTIINFSCSGHLYILLVVIDIVLLVLYFFSGLEVVQALLLPRRRELGDASPTDAATVPSTQPRFGHGTYFSLFAQLLLRDYAIIILTAVSQILSWQLILPNAVIWNWTEAATGKFQAHLSTFRLWKLLLICVGVLWDIVVLIRERWAYVFVRHTFVTALEAIVLVIIVTAAHRNKIFAIGERRYGIERQRLSDAESFAGAVAYANVFNDQLDMHMSTPSSVVRIVYDPLIQSIGISYGALWIVLLVKAALFAHQRKQTQRPQPSAATLARDAATLAREYDRLPSERLVSTAMRARSMMRDSLALEYESPTHHERFVCDEVLFDFGVLVDPASRSVRARVGFSSVIPPSLDLNSSSLGDSLAGEASGAQTQTQTHRSSLTRGLAGLATSGLGGRSKSIRFVGQVTEPPKSVS